VATGLLLSLAFPPFDYYALAVVALVPTALVLRDQPSIKGIFFTGFVGGALFHAAALNWMRSSYGAQGLSGPYVAAWFLSLLAGGIWFLVVVELCRHLLRHRRYPACFVLPVVWVSAEFARDQMLALLEHWGAPILCLGLTLAENAHLAQVADLGGVYALTGLVAAINGLWVDAIHGARMSKNGSFAGSRRVAGFTAALILAAWAYGGWRLHQNAAVGTGPVIWLAGEADLPPLLSPSRFRLPADVAKATLTSHATTAPGKATQTARADLIVWPELAYHHVVKLPAVSHGVGLAINDSAGRAAAGEANRGLSFLEQGAATIGASLLMGCQRIETVGNSTVRYNSLLLIDPHKGLRGVYDKVFLVPWTEFIPRTSRWLRLKSVRKFRGGNRAEVFHLRAVSRDDGFRFGCAICYDIAFAAHFRRMMRAGVDPPDFFIQCGSEGQDQTLCLARLSLRLARLRAIECRRAVVRNVTNGYSGVIDGNGRLIHAVTGRNIHRPELLDPLPLDRRTSLYALTGDWLPMLCCVLLGVGCLAMPGRHHFPAI